ncbi:hypothetical protein QL285_063497 [Trifolium repens]|nr:hypothetical protein QL285_063497 [Trifolium repens]
MHASLQTTTKMTWHSDNYEKRKSSSELRHPSDGLAWKHFDQVHPDFADKPRYVRLRLCSDGFTTYTQVSATPYSCWLGDVYGSLWKGLIVKWDTDDRNFYGIFIISFSSKMTKTGTNTKKNLQNQGKASRPSPRCKKTRKSPKNEENVLIIVARWLPSCHDGSYLLAKKSAEKI